MKRAVDRTAWIAFALGVLATGLTSCGRDSSEARFFGRVLPKHGPAEFWLNNGSEPEYIDPGLCSDSSGGSVIWNTFSALTQPHPVTLEPLPEIAKDWDISPDKRVYTFRLRPSDWSDGHPLTAHDFEWAWKRALDPLMASKYAGIVYPVCNAQAYNEAQLHVRGFAESVTDAEIQAFFETVGPVASVVRRVHPEDPEVARTEAFVKPGGPEKKRSALKKQMLEKLDQQTLGGQPVSVAVCQSDVVGVQALDDLTLKVCLAEPVPYFLSLVNHYTFMPVPRHVIQGLVAKGIAPELWTRPEHHVGNGAFRLVEWKFRRHMVFEKNPRYWDAGRVRLERVKALMIENYHTGLNMYRAGDLDYTGNNSALPAEFIEHLREFQEYRTHDDLSLYFYWINTTRPPMDNVHVRKALSLAIDRSSICKFVTRAGQRPYADLVPEDLGGYQGLDTPLYDPDAARKELEKSGFSGGQIDPRITLMYNTSETHADVAVAIQQMWKDNLGIEVDVDNQEWNVYLGRLKDMDFQVARLGWTGDYIDPNTFLDLLLSSNGNNHSNWRDATFDKMLNDANAEQDPSKRLAMMRKAERYMMDQQPLIPLYLYTKSCLVKPYVRGIWGNYQDRHLWKYIWIDESWIDDPSQPFPDDPLPEYLQEK